MTISDGDALFGQDGTGGDVTGGLIPDGVGPLPAFDLPVVRLPVIGLDGHVTGLDEFDSDLDAGAAVPAPVPVPVPIAGPLPEPPITAPPSQTPWPTAAERAARRPAPARTVAPVRPTTTPSRPPIEDESSILGMARRSRGRFGSRVFAWFFVVVFSVILIQLVVTLLSG